jgi:DNA-binding NtrC family response regulator
MAETPRILIVDDDPQIRAYLSLTFENVGYTVNTAGSGRDAIALCSMQAFDVMLSDVMMPEMNGHQLAQWVSAHYPTIRTALMSGYGAVREKYSLPRECHLIAKPFRADEIVSFVDRVLATS